MNNQEVVQEIVLDKIRANPFQSRPIDEDYVERVLAPDIELHGLLEPALGRVVDDGDVELAFGHHRLAAYRLLQKKALKGDREDLARWSFLPVAIRVLDDRELFQIAVSENQKRKALTPIEQGRTLKAYIDHFHVGQAEAGKLFDFEQSTVSNLISLLEYPEAVQIRIGDGSLPLRYAWLLRPICRFFPNQAVPAADKIAKAKDENRERAAHDAVSQVWQSNAVYLRQMPWSPDWIPDAAMSAEMFQSDKGEPKEAPACKGCAFLQKFDRDQYCARPPCYQLKVRIFGKHELERLSKKLQVPLAAEGEKLEILFEELPYGDPIVNRLLERRPEGLRIVSRAPTGNYSDSRFRDYLGSELVTLASTDKKAMLANLKGTKAKAKAEAAKKETEPQREKRIAAEKKEEVERRVERSAANREKWGIIWMLKNLAVVIGARLDISGGLLVECERLVHWRHSYNLLDDLKPFHEAISADLQDTIYGSAWDYRKADLSPEAQTLRRQHIVFDMLAEDVIGNRGVSEAFDWTLAHRAVQAVIRNQFCLELPKRWDAPPIQHLDFCCWKCGRFAPGEKITQKDISAGWLVVKGEKGETTGVYCPDDAGAMAAKISMPWIPGDKKLAKVRKPRVTRRAKGSGARGMIKAKP